MEPLITAVGISLASYHYKRDLYDYNEVNPGVFVELNERVVIGVYRNSYYKTTLLAAWSQPLVSIGSVNFGAMAGLCSGYEEPSLPICGALWVRYRAVQIMFTPRMGGDTSGAAALTLRFTTQ